jgi:type III pantothenate kinase
MLLAIDIGNTDAVFGFFENEKLLKVCRISAPKEESSLLYYDYRFRNYLLENGLHSVVFEKVVISSVVPVLTDLFVQIAANFTSRRPIVISSDSYDKVKVLIDNPQELGSDLFANAVAAYDKYAHKCIIVDFGTALTFTVVSDNAEVLGVAIAPGLKTAMNSLFSKTAQLPEVPLELPAKVIGTNSIHSIQSGILFGYEGLVRNMLKCIKAELGGNCKVIATGGLSSIIKALNDEFDETDRNLTLNGIRIIGENYL